MKTFFFLLLIPCLSWAKAPPGFFKYFPNRYFVETGTFVGEGTEEALKAGFLEIHSVELSDKHYQYCKQKFANNPQVHLWHGDSGALLEKMIENIQEPITFWIDAHYSDYPTARGDTNTPILRELEIIKNHPIKTHTILIDDVRLFGSSEFDFIPLKTIIVQILEINPNYKISYAHGSAVRDILIASIQP